jgi:membrane dipeptidase
MRYIDFHCDTITELGKDETLICNNRNVNLKSLLDAKVLVQCCSIFIPTGRMGELGSAKRIEKIDSEYQRIYERYQQEMSMHPNELKKVLCYEDIKSCKEGSQCGILLTIEDGGVFEGSLEKLYQCYDDGVRLVTLTWNHENEIGYPNAAEPDLMELGLKEFGVQVVEEMNQLGMIIDVSHLSDGGFYDVVRYAKKPFVASHSNARALTPHPRNMTDDMIRVLSNYGGIMGLNFAPQFLNDTKESKISDMVRHVLHIYQTGGAEVLAIGTDFDGVEGQLEVASPVDMEKLYDALHQAGLSEDVLEKMWTKNALRVLKDCMSK